MINSVSNHCEPSAQHLHLACLCTLKFEAMFEHEHLKLLKLLKIKAGNFHFYIS